MGVTPTSGGGAACFFRDSEQLQLMPLRLGPEPLAHVQRVVDNLRHSGNVRRGVLHDWIIGTT
jgi:hypothetical protein